MVVVKVSGAGVQGGSDSGGGRRGRGREAANKGEPGVRLQGRTIKVEEQVGGPAC